MTARHLEANGIATVVVGSAWDIVNHCKVPRYLHNDIPLGNPLGPPYKPQAHLKSVTAALKLVAESSEPVAVKTDLAWEDGEAWRENYMRVDESNREALIRMGEENRRNRKAQIANGEMRD